MAKCINVLITVACVTSYFFATFSALKVCQLCSSGIACYTGQADPFKGQCATSCDSCVAAGYENCQDCSQDCVALHSSETCTEAQECCGNMGEQTTCANNRCCTIQGTFCFTSLDCCNGLHCSDSTHTCVPITSVAKLSYLFDVDSSNAVNADSSSENLLQSDTKFTDKIKETTAKLAYVTQGNRYSVEEAKSDADEFVKNTGISGRMEADNAVNELFTKLKTKTTEIADRLKHYRDEVVRKAKQKEGEPVEAKKTTGIEMSQKVQSVLSEVDKDLTSDGFKAKVDAILNVDKEKAKGGLQSLKKRNEALRDKMDDVLKADNAEKLVKRIDMSIKEDREKLQARMDETKVKMDEARARMNETKESIEDWTNTHLSFRNSNQTTKLADLDVCFETNVRLLQESNIIKKLVRNVASLFDNIEGGIEKAFRTGRDSMRDFFRDIALDPRRKEELFQEVSARPDSEDIFRSEDETTEIPISLFTLCMSVTDQLRRQNKQLISVLNGLMDMVEAIYNRDFQKFVETSRSLFRFTSAIITRKIEPADGTTPLVDWNEVMLLLPKIEDSSWNLMNGDEISNDGEAEDPVDATESAETSTEPDASAIEVNFDESFTERMASVDKRLKALLKDLETLN